MPFRHHFITSEVTDWRNQKENQLHRDVIKKTSSVQKGLREIRVLFS